MISRGGEKLPAVVALLTHLEEQPLVDLREWEHVGRVDRLVADVVYLVQHVQEVPFRVDPDAFDAGHDLADDLLPGRGVGPVAQAFQIGQEFAVHKRKEGPERRTLELLAFPALRAVAARPAEPGPLVRRGPVAPTIRRLERRRELRPDRLGLLRLAFLALIKDAQEEDPGQLGHILHGPGAVAPPHDVADGLDGGVDGLRPGQSFGVTVLAFRAGHVREIRV
jgi:hypothetical protein